jgi:hypothetical protein
VEFGGYGAKAWRRSSLGLDYRGDYRDSNRPIFNGTNQALSLDYTFQPTNRLLLFARQTGGMTNRAFGGFAAPSFSSQGNFGVPLNEVYDTKTYFSQTSAGVAYRKSARTTLTFLGEGFVVKRSSRALIGMQGYRANGDYDYRLSRVDSIGVYYNYIRFEFPRIYGGSDIHGAGARYRRRLNRNWEVEFVAGLYNSVTTGTQQVQLSPEVAAILGRGTGVEAFRRSEVQPQLELTTNYSLERSRMTLGYRTGIGPGNGIYITSRQEGVNAGYSYTGIKRLSLGLSAGYTRTHSLGLQLGDFTTIQGGGGINYALARHVNLSAQFDRRKFSSPTFQGRNGSSIAVGLSFSPSRIPLSIW